MVAFVRQLQSDYQYIRALGGGHVNFGWFLAMISTRREISEVVASMKRMIAGSRAA